MEIDSSPGNAHGISTRAHSVLTIDLVDEPGHPTRAALDSRAAACAVTSELWRRDSHTGSAFVTVSTAESIMGRFFTLPRCSLRMR